MKNIKKKLIDTSEKTLAVKVSVISIVGNVILSIFKALAGILSHSGAMLSDAIHSASDVFSTIIVIIGVTISEKKSDKEHPYGHERMECVASILLSIFLFATGACIGINGIKKILYGRYEDIQIPGRLALFAAILSIIVKEWMYWYTRAAAKKIRSSALMADAWHHRSDSLSSIGALFGILGSRLGVAIFDPIASVIICLFILKAAIDIFKDSMDKMIDKSCDEKTVQQMKEIIERKVGVEHIDEIRTRIFGTKVYVDIEIAVDGNLTLYASHQIAESVHQVIEREFPQVKHCMVHVNPTEVGQRENHNGNNVFSEK